MIALRLECGLAEGMSKTLVQPYLFFNGRCDEALAFYQKTLDAKVDFLMRYNESPQPPPPDAVPAGFEKKVMHTTFRIGDNILMASDGDDDKPAFGGFSLSLTLPSEDEARQAFNALADGGQVTLPIGKTFWSPCFGMLKDRFGISWMITAGMGSK
jgi:PhnB protein